MAIADDFDITPQRTFRYTKGLPQSFTVIEFHYHLCYGDAPWYKWLSWRHFKMWRTVRACRKRAEK